MYVHLNTWIIKVKTSFVSFWQGAQTVLYCCLTDKEKLISGGFYDDCQLVDDYRQFFFLTYNQGIFPILSFCYIPIPIRHKVCVVSVIQMFGGCSVFAVLLSKLVPLCSILFHENTFATLFEVWGWPSCNLHKIIKWLNDEEYVKRRLLIRMKNWYSKPSHQFKLRQVSDEMVRGFLKRWMSYLRVFSNLLCIIKT